MSFQMFHELCPEVGHRETRTVTLLADSGLGLPAGNYAFLEMYWHWGHRSCVRPCLSLFRAVSRVLSNDGFFMKQLFYPGRLPTRAPAFYDLTFEPLAKPRARGSGTGFQPVLHGQDAHATRGFARATFDYLASLGIPLLTRQKEAATLQESGNFKG